MKDRLYRSRKERVIGGVCGGLAEYFGIDPIIVRIVLVLLVLGHGIGILAYIILWIAVPEEPIQHYYARFQQGAGAPPNPSSTGAEEGTPSENGGAEAPKHEFDYNPMNEDYSKYAPKKSSSGGLVFGIILIALGALFLFWNIIPSFDFELFFPIVVIAAGGLLIFNSIKK